MTSRKAKSFDSQNGKQPGGYAFRFVMLVFVALFTFQAVSCTATGQGYPSGYSTIAPTQGDYSPYSQPLQPLSYPSETQLSPPQQQQSPSLPPYQPPQSQQFPQYQPPQAPDQAMQPPTPNGIQREQVGLAESNPLFDSEADQLMNGMQSTDPSLGMQTFRTGSSDMIPRDIGNVQPIESERDSSQLQSHVGLTPMALDPSTRPLPGGNSPLFGAGEQALGESHDEPFDFSAIMNAQQRLDDSSITGNAGYGYDAPHDSNVNVKFVDIYDKQAVDTEVEDMTVLEVVIEGNGKVPEHSIRHKIRTMAGYPFRLQTVQEDARTLNQTGSFFSVTPRYQRKPDGVVVRFELVERPIFHSVQFVCNANHGFFSPITRKKFAEEAGIKPGDPVDVQLVMHAKEKLKEYLRSEGFERASVVIASGDRATDRNVVFVINEGVKQRVLSTTIEGALFLSSMRTKTYIESKPGVFYYIGGEFSREKLDADVEKLLELYQRYGFFNVQIDRVFEETNGYWRMSEPGSWIKVKFIVSEGPRFKINNIKFVGNEIFTDAELAKDFKLKSGAYFLQGALKMDEASVGRKYGNKGHLFARVQGHVRLIADKPGMVDITYAIREGDPVAITSIDVEIVGDDAHTKTTTLLKHLALARIKPGRLATGDMIKKAESSVSRPGFVNTNPGEGATPRILIVPEGDEIESDGEGQHDVDLQEIDDLIMRGQSPGGYSNHSVLDPRDMRRIQQRNGIGVHPAYPDSGPLEYRVCYPQVQDGYLGGYSTPTDPWNTPLSGSSPYGTSQGTSQYGTQQGSYTIPPQYQLATNQPAPSTVQAGTVPSLSVNTNVTSSPSSAFGFFGQDDPEPYSNSAPLAGSLFTLSSPYGNSNSYAAQNGTIPAVMGGTTTATPTATLDNPIIPATTNPHSYFGDNGYGSVTQASGTFPSTGSYGDFGAPGSITRNANDPFADYARAKAVLRVQEGKTGNLTMSVGINSDSGLVGRFAIEERNFDWRKLPTNPFRIAGWRNAFRGAGQRFLLEAMPGENYQRYMVSFQEPLLGNTRFSLGLNGFYYTRYYDEWRECRAGGGVTLGRAWTDRFSTSLSFNGTNIKVYDPRIPILDLYNVLGDNAQYAFGISGTYDSRDNSIMPTEGGTLTVTAEQVIGTSQFLRGSYDLRRYFALWRRGDHSGAWVLGLRSAAGITEETKTPIYERYYAGGFSTLRGFEYRGITPRLWGYGVGGNFEFYNSVELCFPISADDNFRGVIFVDSGTVETSLSKWESDYRVAPGFGLRLAIPMMGPVPIAFDFAFPINKNTGDVTQMFSFNMGLVR